MGWIKRQNKTELWLPVELREGLLSGRKVGTRVSSTVFELWAESLFEKFTRNSRWHGSSQRDQAAGRTAFWWCCHLCQLPLQHFMSTPVAIVALRESYHTAGQDVLEVCISNTAKWTDFFTTKPLVKVSGTTIWSSSSHLGFSTDCGVWWYQIPSLNLLSQFTQLWLLISSGVQQLWSI